MNERGSKGSNENISDPGISFHGEFSPARGVLVTSKSSRVVFFIFLFAVAVEILDWLWPSLRSKASFSRWRCSSCSIILRLRLAPDHRTSTSFRNATHFPTSSRTPGLQWLEGKRRLFSYHKSATRLNAVRDPKMQLTYSTIPESVM